MQLLQSCAEIAIPYDDDAAVFLGREGLWQCLKRLLLRPIEQLSVVITHGAETHTILRDRGGRVYFRDSHR